MDDVEHLSAALGWDAVTYLSVAGDVREAVAGAEAEIARRGLLDKYALALEEMMDAHIEPPAGYSVWESGNYYDVGRLITAPPEARVQALLKVLS